MGHARRPSGHLRDYPGISLYVTFWPILGTTYLLGWLVSKGKTDQAQKILASHNGAIADYDAKSEVVSQAQGWTDDPKQEYMLIIVHNARHD